MFTHLQFEAMLTRRPRRADPDPAFLLADPQDRGRQVTRWLCQIAADAGLLGMERLTKLQLPAPPTAAHQSTPGPERRQ